MKKLIYGIGFNSRGKHRAKVNGTHTAAYKTWHSMLLRAYCPKYHARHPTYIGCSVTDDWLEYQDFGDWFENHEYGHHGYQLDKDLLIPDNKIYTPETCCFVPRQLNTLLIDCGATRGQYRQGVCFDKANNKFMAQININGKLKTLGRFDTELEAYQTYKTAKEAYVKEKALEWRDRIASDVFDALMNWRLTN